MANGKRMAALAIGVSRTPRLRYLRGALNSAKDFANWATAFGYETRLLTDEAEAVTIARLRGQLDEMLKPAPHPIHRLLLYFAGHGLIREAEEGLWLLSDWFDEYRAVAVEGLRRKLYLHGISQIAIFADACRSMPASIEVSDLNPDHVLGRGPSGRTEPSIDKFIAAQDGAKTYAIPGTTPEQDRCLFSGVLLEGLWGTKPAAFSKVIAGKVTSRSLAEYLRAEVPPLAQRYKLSLTPSVSPTFPEGDDIYFGDGPQRPPPVFAEWPPPEQILAMGLDGSPETTDDVIVRSVTRGAPPPAPAAADPSLLTQLQDQPRPNHYETGSGFAAAGQPVRAVWIPARVHAETAGQANWWRMRESRDKADRLEKPAPFLIEFDDGLFSAMAALPDFVATVLRDARGVSALVYREIFSPPAIASVTERAIATMESGALRVDALANLAVELRHGKHADPVRGVISAYLYDSIGDIDNIRRMAFYYIDNYQPIPYDIALLAHLDTERRPDGVLWAKVPAVARRKPRTEQEERADWTYGATPAREGEIGGFWPWMRQGWTYCDEIEEEGSALVSPGLTDLIPSLTPGRFTTMDREGGRKLAELFGLVAKPSAS